MPGRCEAGFMKHLSLVTELTTEIVSVKQKQVNGEMDPVSAAVVVMELQASLIHILMSEREAA